MRHCWSVGAVAQLGEYLNGIQGVVGSIPTGSTNQNNAQPQAGFGSGVLVFKEF